MVFKLREQRCIHIYGVDMNVVTSDILIFCDGGVEDGSQASHELYSL